MKAIVYSKYGSPDVLQLREVPKPVPAAGDVLVKVHATSVNSYDWRHLRADPFLIRLIGMGLLKPTHQILGGDISGKVEAIGSNVKQFRRGDNVLGGNTFGGFAEYVCVPEEKLILKPASLTFEEAATVPTAALTALQALRGKKAEMIPGQKTLIHGASGGVGIYAVQLAKFFGAEVTGVCSTSKTDLVRAAGADNVIDYKREDVTQCGIRFDRIVDIAAYRSILDYTRILNRHGEYVMVGGSVPRILQLIALNISGRRNMYFMVAKAIQNDLLFIKNLLEEGIIKPFIDRTYPLSSLPEAMWYYEKGYVRGKIVITMTES